MEDGQYHRITLAQDKVDLNIFTFPNNNEKIFYLLMLLDSKSFFLKNHIILKQLFQAIFSKCHSFLCQKMKQNGGENKAGI